MGENAPAHEVVRHEIMAQIESHNGDMDYLLVVDSVSDYDSGLVGHAMRQSDGRPLVDSITSVSSVFDHLPSN